MDLPLEHRLMIAYPGARAWEPDTSVLGANAQDERLEMALLAFNRSSGKRVESTFAPPRLARERVITDADAPPFSTWIWRMDNAAKIDWIRRQDRFYVALWLKVSRIADYYALYFNHWHPRGESGYLDPDCHLSPDPNWQAVSGELEEALGHHGFQRATLDLVGQRSRFVMDQGWDDIAEDDPRLDEPEFEPPLVAATLQQCLFGEP